MELIKDKRCYTDMCLRGKWFHHDHCTATAFMLRGGDPANYLFSKVPETEDELLDLLSDIMK